MTKKSTGIIVKNIKGERYRLTSRRIVELDSPHAQNGEPWYALNTDIRAAALALPYTYIRVSSKCEPASSGKVTITVPFGKPTYYMAGVVAGMYRIGCAIFDFKTFKRILRNAGVQGTQKKAFAAKAGA